MRLAEIRNTKRELYYFQLRLGVAGVVVLAAFTLLFARFFYLQVIQHQYYDTKAEDNRISIVPNPPTGDSFSTATAWCSPATTPPTRLSSP